MKYRGIINQNGLLLHLDALAHQISMKDTDEEGNLFFTLEEFKIEGSLFFITGVISYNLEYSGDGYNEERTVTKRYNDADIEVWWNFLGSWDDDSKLPDDKVRYLLKKIEILN